MVVEDVVCGSELSTRWGLETDWEVDTASYWKRVGLWNWLKPHQGVLIVGLILFIDLGI